MYCKNNLRVLSSLLSKGYGSKPGSFDIKPKSALLNLFLLYQFKEIHSKVFNVVAFRQGQIAFFSL